MIQLASRTLFESLAMARGLDTNDPNEHFLMVVINHQGALWMPMLVFSCALLLNAIGAEEGPGPGRYQLATRQDENPRTIR